MNRCILKEGQIGLRRARKNTGGTVVPVSYGKTMSVALDPIEKGPLRRFLSSSIILSVGGFGCDLRCPFCQDYKISTAREGDSRAVSVSPEKLAKKAAEFRIRGNVGVAYTYDESLVDWEYVRNTGRLVRIAGMKNVIIISGNVFDQALDDILPMANAMNIDLKRLTEQYYRRLGGDFETVKHSITRSSRRCHVKLTTLIIPGESDSGGEMREMVGWIPSLDPGIPLYVSRLFPHWRMDDRPATDVARVYELAQTTREYLKYVWTGNC